MSKRFMNDILKPSKRVNFGLIPDGRTHHLLFVRWDVEAIAMSYYDHSFVYIILSTTGLEYESHTRSK